MSLVGDGIGDPLDHPVDADLRIDVPGKLRTAAKAKRAAGDAKTADAMEKEAKRVEGKRAKLAKLSPGQRAVINRMHARENALDGKTIAIIVGSGLTLLTAAVIARGSHRRV